MISHYRRLFSPSQPPQSATSCKYQIHFALSVCWGSSSLRTLVFVCCRCLHSTEACITLWLHICHTNNCWCGNCLENNNITAAAAQPSSRHQAPSSHPSTNWQPILPVKLPTWWGPAHNCGEIQPSLCTAACCMLGSGVYEVPFTLFR